MNREQYLWKINRIIHVVGQDKEKNEGRKVIFIDCLLSDNCCDRNVYLRVSLNFLHQNFREHTNSNNHCRMQLHLLHDRVYSWLLVSTKHMLVLHSGALGSDKQQMINITDQEKNNFPGLLCPHSQAYPLQEIIPLYIHVYTSILSLNVCRS